MSLHWPSLFQDRLCIYMHPQYLSAMRLRSGLKRGIVRHQRIGLAEAAAGDWQPACAALSRLLEHKDWQQARPEIVLSNHFVRYAIIPWNDSVAGQDERQSYMRHCFQAIYGELVQGWDLRMHDAGYGRPSLASAVDKSLINAVVEMCGLASMRLQKMHPQLMLAANGLAELPPSFWLVAIESGRLSIALVDNGDWRVVKTMAVEHDFERHVHAIIQRESVLHMAAAASWPVVCHWPQRAGVPEFVLPDRKLGTMSDLGAGKAWEASHGMFRLAVWQ